MWNFSSIDYKNILICNKWTYMKNKIFKVVKNKLEKKYNINILYIN